MWTGRGSVPSFLAVLAEQVGGSSGGTRAPSAVFLQKVAAEDVVARAFADLANLLRRLRYGGSGRRRAVACFLLLPRELVVETLNLLLEFVLAVNLQGSA